MRIFLFKKEVKKEGKGLFRYYCQNMGKNQQLQISKVTNIPVITEGEYGYYLFTEVTKFTIITRCDYYTIRQIVTLFIGIETDY